MYTIVNAELFHHAGIDNDDVTVDVEDDVENYLCYWISWENMVYKVQFATLDITENSQCDNPRNVLDQFDVIEFVVMPELLKKSPGFKNGVNEVKFVFASLRMHLRKMTKKRQRADITHIITHKTKLSDVIDICHIPMHCG
jgi:hypothetical protein